MEISGMTGWGAQGMSSIFPVISISTSEKTVIKIMVKAQQEMSSGWLNLRFQHLLSDMIRHRPQTTGIGKAHQEAGHLRIFLFCGQLVSWMA
jgi:hypothetical protein